MATGDAGPKIKHCKAKAKLMEPSNALVSREINRTMVKTLPWGKESLEDVLKIAVLACRSIFAAYGSRGGGVGK